MLLASINQFYAPHGDLYTKIFTGAGGVALAFLRRWPTYFSLIKSPTDSHTITIRARTQPAAAAVQSASAAAAAAQVALPDAPQQVPQVDSAAAAAAPHVVPIDHAAPVLSAPVSYETHDAEVETLLSVVDTVLRVGMLAEASQCSKLRDIHLDSCRPIAACTSEREGRAELPLVIVTQQNIDNTVKRLGGAKAFGHDNRAGISGSLHRISAMRDRKGAIYGLSLRVGRSLEGIALMIEHIALRTNQSILVLGEPGSGNLTTSYLLSFELLQSYLHTYALLEHVSATGKTGLVRDLARLLAIKSNVCIVDTSNELGGEGLTPHSSIGNARRMMVPSLDAQAKVMVECVQVDEDS
jgi:stage III sporulation protein SpoIIIAA